MWPQKTQAKEFINDLEPEALVELLKRERPSVGAFVLSWLSPEKGAQILKLLPPELAAKLIEVEAKTTWADDRLLTELKAILEHSYQFLKVAQERKKLGGKNQALAIARHLDPEHLKLFGEQLDLKPLLELDQRSFMRLWMELDSQKRLMALKVVTIEEKEALLSRFPTEARSRLIEDYNALGPKPKSQALAALREMLEQIPKQ